MMSARGPQTDTEPKGTRARRRNIALIAAVVAASAGILSLAFWTGNGSLLLAAGAGMGAWLGVHFGNRKAREVDAYRREWLGKRARGTNRRGLDAHGSGAAGQAAPDKNTDDNNSKG